MRALLLAAGRGTRLGELSNTTPKCLQVVRGQTVLDRLVSQLTAAGVDEFLINAHHLADLVADHVHQAPWSDRATLVYEPQLLGTLGTLRANVSFFEAQAGWVLHADNFIDGGLVRLRDSFASRSKSAWGSMLTFRVARPSEFGVVTVDPQGLMSGFFEKVDDPPSDLASAATFIFGARALEVAQDLPSTATDISHDLIPRLVGRLEVVVHGERIIDIGTPENLAEAQRLAD